MARAAGFFGLLFTMTLAPAIGAQAAPPPDPPPPPPAQPATPPEAQPQPQPQLQPQPQPPPPPPGYGYPPPGGYYQQPGYGYPPPPGYAYPPPPPPGPPPPDPSEHRHDGFYLRMGLGAAYGRVLSQASVGGNDIEITYKGWGPAYELLIGGTLGSGVVLGGGFVGQDIDEPEVSADVGGNTQFSAVAEGESLGIVVLGPFIDWFPDETGGAHVGAMVGIGGIGLRNEDGDPRTEDDVSTGLGVSLFGGYDFWVGNQWSIGPGARLVWVTSEREVLGQTFDDSAMSFEILFSALFH